MPLFASVILYKIFRQVDLFKCIMYDDFQEIDVVLSYLNAVMSDPNVNFSEK